VKIKRTLSTVWFALACLAAFPAAAHDLKTETVLPKAREPIPNLPGKVLVVVEVDYAPGAASHPHTHAKSAFIYAYVLSGEIESKVDDGPTRIYKAGDSWSEQPGAVHSISRNASKTKAAKLLAVFIVDADDKKLTNPIEQN